MSSGRSTVVVPCGGTGSRLGWPFAKELTPIGERRVLLDATLELIAPCADTVRLVVVVDGHREATIRHLQHRCAQLEVPWAVVYQPAQLVESTGAVLSAQAWFTAANLVLLPDQLLLRPLGTEVAAALGAIHQGAAFCFLAARETDPARLAADGALRLQPGATPGEPAMIADYADKPRLARAAEFNAVWFGYAFAKSHAAAALHVLHTATVDRHLPVDGLGPLHGSPVVEVGPFVDLGTWPAIRRHLSTVELVTA
jgi:mannose-1-phosphate guanylyltransferase